VAFKQIKGFNKPLLAQISRCI